MKFYPSILFIFMCLLVGCSSNGSDDDTNNTSTYSIPTVVINSMSEVTKYSASGVAFVSNDGGRGISEKGLCWSTTTNPTTSSFKTNEGPGVGTFISQLDELSNGTTYYVRAYATNSEGTAYSDQLTITTLDCNTSVHEGDVILRSQEEVDAFGFNGNTEINGDLTINDNGLNSSSRIEDLRPLRCLQNISGSLFISESDQLLDIEGLNSLVTVGNSVVIDYNSHLTDLDGLENLTSINRSLTIDENDLLNIDGLNNLNSIGESLVVKRNSRLDNLNGLNNLTSNIVSLTINNNAILETLSGINNIARIEENIEISFNNALKNLSDLIDVEMNGANFEVYYNLELENLSGLENVTNIGGNLKVYHNVGLMNLTGLDNLILVDGDIFIWQNTDLNSLEGLNKLSEITGSFTLEKNPKILKLDGLESFVNMQTSENVSVYDNEALVDFCGLTNLFTIGTFNGALTISDNAYNPSYQDLLDGNCSQ